MENRFKYKKPLKFSLLLQVTLGPYLKERAKNIKKVDDFFFKLSILYH